MAELKVEGLKAASDTAKQIITLSTGVTALTITFLEKIAKGPPPVVLKAAWIGFGLSLFFGLVTLLAVTGTLTAVDRRNAGLDMTPAQQKVFDANGANVRIPALAMVLCFLAAMACVIGAGFFL